MRVYLGDYESGFISGVMVASIIFAVARLVCSAVGA